MLGFKFQILPRTEWLQVPIRLKACSSLQRIKYGIEWLKKRDISDHPVPQLHVFPVICVKLMSVEDEE
jgi:hypothetical protein